MQQPNPHAVSERRRSGDADGQAGMSGNYERKSPAEDAELREGHQQGCWRSARWFGGGCGQNRRLREHGDDEQHGYRQVSRRRRDPKGQTKARERRSERHDQCSVRLPFRKSAEHGNDSRAQETERERGDVRRELLEQLPRLPDHVRRGAGEAARHEPPTEARRERIGNAQPEDAAGRHAELPREPARNARGVRFQRPNPSGAYGAHSEKPSAPAAPPAPPSPVGAQKSHVVTLPHGPSDTVPTWYDQAPHGPKGTSSWAAMPWSLP